MVMGRGGWWVGGNSCLLAYLLTYPFLSHQLRDPQVYLLSVFLKKKNISTREWT